MRRCCAEAHRYESKRNFEGHVAELLTLTYNCWILFMTGDLCISKL